MLESTQGIQVVQANQSLSSNQYQLTKGNLECKPDPMSEFRPFDSPVEQATTAFAAIVTARKLNK